MARECTRSLRVQHCQYAGRLTDRSVYAIQSHLKIWQSCVRLKTVEKATSPIFFGLRKYFVIFKELVSQSVIEFDKFVSHTITSVNLIPFIAAVALLLKEKSRLSTRVFILTNTQSGTCVSINLY